MFNGEEVLLLRGTWLTSGRCRLQGQMGFCLILHGLCAQDHLAAVRTSCCSSAHHFRVHEHLPNRGSATLCLANRNNGERHTFDCPVPTRDKWMRTAERGCQASTSFRTGNGEGGAESISVVSIGRLGIPSPPEAKLGSCSARSSGTRPTVCPASDSCREGRSVLNLVLKRSPESDSLPICAQDSLSFWSRKSLHCGEERREAALGLSRLRASQIY